MELRTEDWDLLLRRRYLGTPFDQDRLAHRALSVESSCVASDSDEYNSDDEERAQAVVGDQRARQLGDLPFPIRREDSVEGATMHEYKDYIIERREYKDSVAVIKDDKTGNNYRPELSSVDRNSRPSHPHCDVLFPHR